MHIFNFVAVFFNLHFLKTRKYLLHSADLPFLKFLIKHTQIAYIYATTTKSKFKKQKEKTHQTYVSYIWQNFTGLRTNFFPASPRTLNCGIQESIINKVICNRRLAEVVSLTLTTIYYFDFFLQLVLSILHSPTSL